MTEAEWLACEAPRPMLEFLRGKASDRKLRLFACACCRRIWHLLKDERARRAVEIAERFADGLAGDDERSNARKLAQQAAQGRGVTTAPTAPKCERRAASAAYYATACQAMEAAYNAPDLVVEVLVWQAGGYANCDSRHIRREEEGPQAQLLRDLLGNPFRLVRFEPGWRTGNVIDLARTIYKEHAFERLPILADALMDAGCDSADILSHCRSSGPHVRGCWVIDLLLGKS